MWIQLVGGDEASVDSDRTKLNRWREYVDTYVMDHTTEWMGGADDRVAKGTRPIFLKR